MRELAPWVKWVVSRYWRLLPLVEEVEDGQLLILHVLKADSLPCCQTYMRRIPQEYERHPGENEALSAGEIDHFRIDYYSQGS